MPLLCAIGIYRIEVFIVTWCVYRPIKAHCNWTTKTIFYYFKSPLFCSIWIYGIYSIMRISTACSTCLIYRPIWPNHGPPGKIMTISGKISHGFIKCPLYRSIGMVCHYFARATLQAPRHINSSINIYCWTSCWIP